MCALQATEQSDPALPYTEDMEEEEDDGAMKGGWTSAGLPRDQNKEASDRRTKHQGGERFSLAETKKVLPGLDRAGLDVLRNAVNGKSCAFPARFFDLCFPEEIVDFLAEKVTVFRSLSVSHNKYVWRALEAIKRKNYSSTAELFGSRRHTMCCPRYGSCLLYTSDAATKA